MLEDALQGAWRDGRVIRYRNMMSRAGQTDVRACLADNPEPEPFQNPDDAGSGQIPEEASWTGDHWVGDEVKPDALWPFPIFEVTTYCVRQLFL